MSDFDAAVQIVLDDEGILNDHPITDPDGGLTNFGISQKQNPDIDVAHLTRPKAIAVYRIRYWDPIAGDKLSWPLNLMVFDCAVNEGVETAARLLQEALGVAVDGYIGPQTLTVVGRRDPVDLTARFCALRLKAYAALPEYPADGEGWFYRVAMNLLASTKSKEISS